MRKLQNVMIKGTKDGLILHLDDTCSFPELMKELEDKISIHYKQEEDAPLVTVRIHTGYRYLTRKQEQKIRDLIRHKKNLVVDTIESNVITKEDADRLRRESEIVSVAKVVRSGQVLTVPGDLLLIGDVNPGGKVVASGNIFILGALKGIAHAGFEGNHEAVICASLMQPTQLRIGEYINRAPDWDDGERHEMECAYIDQSKVIVIDRIQSLFKLRPNLTRFIEGGL